LPIPDPRLLSTRLGDHAASPVHKFAEDEQPTGMPTEHPNPNIRIMPTNLDVFALITGMKLCVTNLDVNPYSLPLLVRLSIENETLYNNFFGTTFLNECIRFFFVLSHVYHVLYWVRSHCVFQIILVFAVADLQGMPYMPRHTLRSTGRA
jgi:hypothetical protein